MEMAHASEEQKKAAKKVERSRAASGRTVTTRSTVSGKVTKKPSAAGTKKEATLKPAPKAAQVYRLAEHMLRKLPPQVLKRLSEADLEALAEESAGLLVSKFAPAANPLAARIGPTYRAEQLARYLPGLDTKQITAEAVRKRAKHHQLVGFRSADRVWLFPQWQFRTAVGRLEPIEEVIAAWADLPHDGVLAEVDLVAWMATRRKDLDSSTPAQWAAEHGYDERLRRAVRSVRRRAA
jgi:hypothetical protein